MTHMMLFSGAWWRLCPIKLQVGMSVGRVFIESGQKLMFFSFSKNTCNIFNDVSAWPS